MARRKRISKAYVAFFALTLALVAGAVVLWQAFGHRWLHPSPAGHVVETTSERADPANEGRSVHVSGRLETNKPAYDPQFGVAADAAILFRKVEMYQWRERCSGGACAYEQAWSALPIDSRRFREPAGHENPPARFADARFIAAGLRLGAYALDPELVAHLDTVEKPVRAADLPPNLAATFSDSAGVLYAGGEPAHPHVGTVRVTYRVVPLSKVELTGVQHGQTLALH